MTIQNGGRVFSHTGTIAGGNGGTGQVTVTGLNSSWHTAEEIYVGNRGTGSLNILNGGVVSNSGANGVIVGNFNGSSGTVTVSGAGSTLSIARALFLGGRLTFGRRRDHDGPGRRRGGHSPRDIAAAAGPVGTLNIGAAAGAAAVRPAR